MLWFRFIILYIHQYELSELFDFDDGSVAIGTWIAIVLFVLSFIIAITSQNKIEQSVQQTHYVISNHCTAIPNTTPKRVETDNKFNQVNIQYGVFCPNGGVKQEKSSKFCGKCGYNLNRSYQNVLL